MASDSTDNQTRFRDVVKTEAELRAILGSPDDLVLEKVIDFIDEPERVFIAQAPFVIIASIAGNGRVDVSPKGDPAGFVKVLDERTIAIPDRLGNARLDTLTNILVNPGIGVFFMIPGVSHTLRVGGRATIVRDEDVRQLMAVNGKMPNHAIVVAVEHVMSHCSKCMTRSGLWKPASWPDPKSVPTLAEMLVAHAPRSAGSVDAVQTLIDDDGRKRMY